MNGELIKSLRRDKNLTQKELGKILNLTQKSITKYENNTAQMSYETIIKFCDYFEITADYFLGRENDYGIIETQNILTIEENQILELYRKLNETYKNRLIGYATALTLQGVNNERK